jgi:hypothetical protein
MICVIYQKTHSENVRRTVIIRFRLGHIHIYIQIILVSLALDETNIRKATHESTTMAKT